MATFSEPDVVFSQYAQDPYEEYHEMMRQAATESPAPLSNINTKKSKRRREGKARKQVNESFVMSKAQRRGLKLIKISVIDLCNNPQPSDSDSDTDNIIIRAQYIVKDALDSIMDDTECLVKKISKSLIESDL